MTVRVSVLTYHSISSAPGPTSIAPGVFRDQMAALADRGYQPVSLTALRAWLGGAGTLPDRPVVITFDDGFADFAEQAAPVLLQRHWPATVFLPTGRIGGDEDWAGANRSPARRLMGWDQVRALAAEGISFGGHSVTHPDLTRLSPERLTEEIRQSRDDLARHLGRAPTTFAPPYGASNRRVRAEIARWFEVSVGVTLGRAAPHSDPFDVPRIEMYYFRKPERWGAFLDGRGAWYFTARRALRAARGVVTAARPVKG